MSMASPLLKFIGIMQKATGEKTLVKLVQPPAGIQVDAFGSTVLSTPSRSINS